MTTYARRRDDVEPEIVKALTQVGASVEKLEVRNVQGIPDLLVGINGRTYLLEVKEEHGRAWKGRGKTASGLLPSQEKWWSRWKGGRPVVVTTIDEALRAIGVTR